MLSLRSEIHDKLSEAFVKVFRMKPNAFTVEIPPKGFGDYSSNIAMVNAKLLKKSPRAIAQELVDDLKNDEWFEYIEIAGPGFVNLNVSFKIFANVLKETINGLPYPKIGSDSVQLEYVSANPTGPLTVGHGRQAIIGDVLSRVYKASGYKVTREYYFNDAGKQMKMLGHSLWIRYRELYGKKTDFSEDDYRGTYLIEVAKEFKEKYGDAYVEEWNEKNQKIFIDFARDRMFEWIKKTLKELGVDFDVYFRESSLYEDGTTDEAMKMLRDKGYVYEKDGTTWFAVSKLIPEEDDRVIIRKNGEPTYFFSDIAYMLNKYKRGFKKVYYIWGADHHGYIPRMRAASKALGFPEDFFNVIIHQFVTLKSGEEVVRMSKRQGEFTTLEDLTKKVGRDVTRYFFAMLDPNTHLVFDMKLAESKKMDNPVYYVQYAHARIFSLIEKAKERDIEWDNADFEKLGNTQEKEIAREIAEFPEVITSVVTENKPQKLCNYAYSLAEKFHSYYNANKIVDENNKELSANRIKLCMAVGRTIKEVLSLLGINAPTSM